MFHTPRGVQLCSENPSKQCDTCMCMLDTETDGSTLQLIWNPSPGCSLAKVLLRNLIHVDSKVYQFIYVHPAFCLPLIPITDLHTCSCRYSIHFQRNRNGQSRRWMILLVHNHILPYMPSLNNLFLFCFHYYCHMLFFSYRLLTC